MVLSDESNGGTKEHPIHNIREALDKKLVQLLYDCESPGTIERELRDYQRELLEKPTRKQLVNYVFGILGNNAERPQKSVYVDTETENYIISVQLKHDRDGLAKTIGSMYVHPNGSNKQRVMVTPFGKYNLKAEEGDIKLLAKHGIVWWGINPSLRRIQGVDGNNVF